MQPLLDGVRAGLTGSKVVALLQSQSAIQISYGALGLNQDFDFVADLAGYMTAGSQITSSSLATIHRTCTLNIDSDVSDVWNYMSGFIQPYMIFTDMATGYAAQFNLGVYTLTTPAVGLATSPSIASFTGYDLIYLLQQQIGDSYQVPVGSDPAQAAAECIDRAIPGAGVSFSASDELTLKPLTFPFDPSKPWTYLDVVNTLLNSIGYRQIWVDWEGIFRIEPFEDPQEENAEWVFSLVDENVIVGEDRAQSVDLFDVPNWFRFVMGNLTTPAVEGVSMFTFQDSSATNAGSTLNRGRLVRHIESVTATSYLALVQYAKKVIAKMLKPSETFSMSTQPFPMAWHMDIVAYIDPNLGPVAPAYSHERHTLALDWSLPLDGRTDMTWTLQTITDQTVEQILTSIEVA